jgi:hypothetical protein
MITGLGQQVEQTPQALGVVAVLVTSDFVGTVIGCRATEEVRLTITCGIELGKRCEQRVLAGRQLRNPGAPVPCTSPGGPLMARSRHHHDHDCSNRPWRRSRRERRLGWHRWFGQRRQRWLSQRR